MQRPVILLVDDEVDLVQVMHTALSHSMPEYEILTATSLEEAEDIVDDLRATGSRLSLVLVDHVLGGRTGMELLESLRTGQPKVPALLVTGQAPSEVEQRAHELGVRVLWKPMRLAELERAVRDALSVA